MGVRYLAVMVLVVLTKLWKLLLVQLATQCNTGSLSALFCFSAKKNASRGGIVVRTAHISVNADENELHDATRSSSSMVTSFVTALAARRKYEKDDFDSGSNHGVGDGFVGERGDATLERAAPCENPLRFFRQR
jgi:hypothetical protein